VTIEAGGWRQIVSDYVTLTKPKVQSLLLLTTVCSMQIAGDPSLRLIALTVAGGYLSAGGAGAVNHYYDRDIDAQMPRTANRPVPAGRVAPRVALIYVGVPMLPVVRGENETRTQILVYAIGLCAATLVPVYAAGLGTLYLVCALVLGVLLIGGATILYRRADRRSALRLYLFSLAYLALLFAAMVLDAKLR